MAPPIPALFKFLDVLSTFRDKVTNFILAQLGSVVDGIPESQEAEWWQQPGFCSRPLDGTQGVSACQVVAITRSDRDVCIAGRDSRAASIYGQLAPGETCAYASGSQARLLLKTDGSCTMLTTSDNTKNGTTCAVRLEPTRFRVDAPYGNMVFDATHFLLVSSDGKAFIEMKPGGVITISAATLNLVAGQMMLGKNASAATPVLVGTSGPTAIPSTTLFGSP